MPEKKYTWYKIAESEQELLIGKNGIGTIEVKGKKICITKFENQWYAFAFRCPHASGILADGYIDIMGNIVCPVHRYRFSIRNGRNSSGEGFYMKTYPAQLKPEGIFVGLLDSGLFGWL